MGVFSGCGSAVGKTGVTRRKREAGATGQGKGRGSFGAVEKGDDFSREITGAPPGQVFYKRVFPPSKFPTALEKVGVKGDMNTKRWPEKFRTMGQRFGET